MPAEGAYPRLVKVVLDKLGAVFFLALLSPLFLGVALAVWLSDGRPIFYSHRRVGLHGREFELHKFRTMVKGADRIGPAHTDRGDPRVTPLGLFLRRSSLDELPQLVNVLKGDMSLVGPRPDTPAQMAAYTEDQRSLRCSVRPGLTGHAQAAGRSDLTPDRRLQLDVEYAHRVSMALDVKILFKTAWLVIRGRGAW